MNDLMTNLGLNAKHWVGISLSPNNKLELVCLDKTAKAISNYSNTDVQYNNAIREIVDEDEFKEGLQTLFNNVDLNPKSCNVLLNLPNVHFGVSTLDGSIADDEVYEALLAEVTDLYIFKKNDPMIEYQIIGRNQDTGELLVVYSVIQRKTIDFVKECFADIGANLVSVETINSSLLKGIQYSNFSSFDFSSVNIMHISANSYSIFNFNNNYLMDYYEEPLAIKSFSNEEVYTAIASAASATLSKYDAQNLLIISETDEINAELLASQINFAGSIEYIDRNKWTNGCFIEILPEAALMQDLIPYISVEAVGVAATMYEDYILSFSFIHDGKVQTYETINIFGHELSFPQYLLLVIFIALIIALIIYFVIGLSYKSKTDALRSDNSRLESKIDELGQQISASKANKTTQDIFEVAQGVQNANLNDFVMVNALSTDIPSKVWIEKFMLASEAFTTIVGKSLSESDVKEFFQNLQQRDPALKLTIFTFDKDNPDYVDGVYNFEMTNDAIVSSAFESSLGRKSKKTGLDDGNGYSSVPDVPSYPSMERPAPAPATPAVRPPQDPGRYSSLDEEFMDDPLMPQM